MMPTLELVFRAERQSDGSYRGTVVVPAIPGAVPPPELTSALPPGAAPKAVVATAKGKTKKAAVARTANAALKALDNPMVQAVMPPQAVAAIKTAKAALKVGKKLRKLF
jgi:hypothetical protein